MINKSIVKSLVVAQGVFAAYKLRLATLSPIQMTSSLSNSINNLKSSLL